jgi:LPXTG-motif cell wall-anchored protein
MRKDYNFVNKYILLDLDVLKVEKGKETSTMLPGAVFELRKLEDVAPTNPGGTLTYVKDNNQQVVVTSETTGDDGRLTFSNLTYGVYEIREVIPPPGYIQTEDVTFYLRVDGGVITYVQKGSNKPSEWTAAQNSDGATVYFMEAQAANPDSTPPTASANATFRVGNTPGAALPNTGGPGIRLFTILGSILILGASVLLWRRRRLI